MKRTLVVVVLCILLIATVGVTAVVAEQKGKSPIYQFVVPGVDGREKGPGSGKLIVDTKTDTFVFNGHNGVAGTGYGLYYNPSADEVYPLGSGVADVGGNVHIKGTLQDGVNWGAVQVVKVGVLEVTPPLDTPVITSPAEGAILIGPENIIYSWTAVPGATSYKFEGTVTSPQGWVTSFGASSGKNKYIEEGGTGLVPSGTYTFEWKVMAVYGPDETRNSDWSAQSTFFYVHTGDVT